jgi:hypothetical protein
MLLSTPDIQYTVTDQPAPIMFVFIIAMVLLIISLMFNTVGDTIRSVIIGCLFLFAGIGTLAYMALNFQTLSTVPVNTSAIEKNKTELQQWAQNDYGITLNPNQVSELLGSAGETIIDKDRDLEFGSTSVETLPNTTLPGPHVIKFVYIDENWKLKEYTPEGKLREIVTVEDDK